VNKDEEDAGASPKASYEQAGKGPETRPAALPPIEGSCGLEKMLSSRLLAPAVTLVCVYFLAQGAIHLATLWMLIFGSVVVAVIIRSVADPLVRWAKLKDGLAVLIAVLVILAVLGGIGYIFGREINRQIQQLIERLPAAWDQLQARLEASPAIGKIVDLLRNAASDAGRALALAPKIAIGAMSGVATLFLVLVAGVFLAVQPAQAREGVLSMVPKPSRPRLREVMDASGRALRGWLKAQLVSMTLVGSLVGVGLALIGVPAPLALGLVSGVAQFVPIVGPIVSAVPGLLVAATGGTQTLLLALALYVGVSQLEANLITPLVQKNVAALPVVLGIFAVVGLGILFGPLGVLFATPLTLVAYTAITMLYRHDVLHDENATAPGQMAGGEDFPIPDQ
jgi:predicted PurR-regulated permease PerM